MQFYIIMTFIAAIFGVVTATPMSLHEIRSCDLVGCAAALGPTAASCGFAAAKKGKDASRDVACLAGAVNLVENVPAKCSACKSTLGSAVKDAENVASKAEHAAVKGAKKVVSGAKHAASDVKHFIGGIF